jgi:hypothetical protein
MWRWNELGWSEERASERASERGISGWEKEWRKSGMGERSVSAGQENKEGGRGPEEVKRNAW